MLLFEIGDIGRLICSYFHLVEWSYMIYPKHKEDLPLSYFFLRLHPIVTHHVLLDLLLSKKQLLYQVPAFKLYLSKLEGQSDVEQKLQCCLFQSLTTEEAKTQPVPNPLYFFKTLDATETPEKNILICLQHVGETDVEQVFFELCARDLVHLVQRLLILHKKTVHDMQNWDNADVVLFDSKTLSYLHQSGLSITPKNMIQRQIISNLRKNKTFSAFVTLEKLQLYKKMGLFSSDKDWSRLLNCFLDLQYSMAALEFIISNISTYDDDQLTAEVILLCKAKHKTNPHFLPLNKFDRLFWSKDGCVLLISMLHNETEANIKFVFKEAMNLLFTDVMISMWQTFSCLHASPPPFCLLLIDFFANCIPEKINIHREAIQKDIIRCQVQSAPYFFLTYLKLGLVTKQLIVPLRQNFVIEILQRIDQDEMWYRYLELCDGPNYFFTQIPKGEYVIQLVDRLQFPLNMLNDPIIMNQLIKNRKWNVVCALL